jgi:hypothetical protein
MTGQGLKDGDWCPIGPLSLHTLNYQRNECIWCGPHILAWQPGEWIDIGDGFDAWSATTPDGEVSS